MSGQNAKPKPNVRTEPSEKSGGFFAPWIFSVHLHAPVPYAVAVPANRSLLRFCVTLLRAMLRYVSRKSLIYKQCYMLRFFENECGGQIGKTCRKVQIVPRYILG